MHLGFHAEQFHEGFDFDIRVLVLETLTSTEEPVILISRYDSILRRPLLNFSCFLVVVAILFFSFTFAILVSVFVIITFALGAIELLFFFLYLGVALGYETLLGHASAIARDIFNSFNGSQ